MISPNTPTSELRKAYDEVGAWHQLVLELFRRLEAAERREQALAAQLDRPRIRIIGDLMEAGIRPEAISEDLAALKAQWQAEALEEILPAMTDWSDRSEVRSAAAELRRQAKESGS